MLEIESKKLKGTYRCQFYHDHEKLIAGLDEGKNSSLIYQKSVAIKKAINDMLFQKKTEDEALVELKEAFDKVGYATPETERRHLEESWRQILRYVHSETRQPEHLARKMVSPFQLMNVSFKADYLFSGYKAYVRKTKVGRKVETYHTTEPYVEVVRIRPGKPDVSKGSKKKDKGVMTCLELYCMLMYAKEVAETMAFLRDEKVINVEASYYYLRRNGDKVEDIREDDFFDNKSKNVLTFSDVYYTADPNRKTEVDANFKKEFLEFFQSQECDPESCEHCTLNAVCNFTKPPEYIEKELTQKSLDSISLTEAQEKVIGFRKGFARVNAGAGAGKTMCVALRTAFLLSEGVDPAKICLLTFTNTGAAEMKERIGLYCEDFGLNINLDTLTVTTFNSFGDKIIHKNYEELGFEKEPRLIDDIEQSKIVAEMLKDNVVADLDYRNFNMNMPFVKGALPTAKKAFEIIKRENLSNESDVDVLWEKMKNESYDIAKTAAAALIELYGEYDDQLRERSLIEYSAAELLTEELADAYLQVAAGNREIPATVEKAAKYEYLRAKASSVSIVQEESCLVEWIKNGGVMCFNEMNMAEANFFASFTNQLTDNTGFIDIPGYGHLEINPDCILIGTQNADYTGVCEQNDATMSRFGCIQFPYPKSIKAQLEATVGKDRLDV